MLQGDHEMFAFSGCLVSSQPEIRVLFIFLFVLPSRVLCWLVLINTLGLQITSYLWHCLGTYNLQLETDSIKVPVILVLTLNLWLTERLRSEFWQLLKVKHGFEIS